MKILKLVSVVIVLLLAGYCGTAMASDMLKEPEVEQTTYTPLKANLTVDGLLTETNRYRANLLILDKELNQTAMARCEDISLTGKFEHGDHWMDRMVNLGRRTYGENLNKGLYTDSKAVDAWVNSPTHYKNIVDPNFRYIGFAYCDMNGLPVIVQHFSS